MYTPQYTRAQYLKDGGAVAHRKYYAQYVTPHIISLVVHNIGAEKLKASKAEQFNDIPLQFWDDLYIPVAEAALQELGDFKTLSMTVCIAKEAARQWVESLN